MATGLTGLFWYFLCLLFALFVVGTAAVLVLKGRRRQRLESKRGQLQNESDHIDPTD